MSILTEWGRLSRMKGRTELFDRAKKQIERQMAVQEDVQRRALMKKRLDFVTSGLELLSKHKAAEAVIAFRNYIKLLEDFKGVGDGGLTPAHFDYSKDLGDLLLLSGIYWELTKLFDRTNSEETKQLFFQYLEKFIMFSSGVSYQALSAEGLRRYLAHGKPTHRDAFKNAYKVLGKGKCFVVSSLIDVIDYETLPAFWSLRDDYLVHRAWGRAFVRAYYAVGPTLARAMDVMPDFVRRACGTVLDRVARKLNG
jgi:hypothetical protein